VIEVKCLERVVSADAVTRRFCRESSAFDGFISIVTTGYVSGYDKIIVLLTWDNEKFRHGCGMMKSECGRILREEKLEIFSLAVEPVSQSYDQFDKLLRGELYVQRQRFRRRFERGELAVE
jgi:hypothetical protein